MMNGSFIWYKNFGSRFRFVTMHAFDRRTDEQTDVHSIRNRTVKADLLLLRNNKSSAVAEMAAQCCTTRSMKRWVSVSFRENSADREARRL